MNTNPSEQKEPVPSENQPKLDPQKVEVKDLDLKARQMRVRGGSKCLGRIGRAIGNVFGTVTQ